MGSQDKALLLAEEGPSVDYPGDAKGRGFNDVCWPLAFLVNVCITTSVVMHIGANTFKALLMHEDSCMAIFALLCFAMLIGCVIVLVFMSLQNSSPAYSMAFVFGWVLKITIGSAIGFFYTDMFAQGAVMVCLTLFAMIYICARWVSLRLTNDLNGAVHDIYTAAPGVVSATSIVVLFPGLFCVGCTLLVLLHLFAVTRLEEKELEFVGFLVLGYLSTSLYWTLGILGNTTFALSSGAVARWHCGDRQAPVRKALLQVYTRAAGSICFSAFLRGPVWVARMVGNVTTVLTGDRHDKGNQRAAKLMTSCCGGCMRSRRAESLMFLGRDALVYVMLYGEDLCSAAHRMATHRFGSGFQEIADSNMTFVLSGFVAVFCTSFFSGLLMAVCFFMPSMMTLLDDSNLLGGVPPDARLMEWIEPWSEHSLLTNPWPARLFFPLCASVVAAELCWISGFLEGGASGVVACWAEDTAVLERVAPKLHDKLRAHVLAYGEEPPAKGKVYSSGYYDDTDSADSKHEVPARPDASPGHIMHARTQILRENNAESDAYSVE